MEKFVIIDNVLEQQDFLSIKNLEIKSGTIYWYNFRENSYLDKLLNISHDYYPCLDSAGYEIWSNNSAIDWHVDIDDAVCKQSGTRLFPICTIVYYVHVEIFNGGDLVLPTVMVQPIPNRMVIFGPNIRHAVKKYEGERRAISINPWVEKPKKYFTQNTSEL